MYQAVQGDVGKGILEIPPAAVTITVNTTWSAALISRESAPWVSPESRCPLLCHQRCPPESPCCAASTLLHFFLLKCLSLRSPACCGALNLRTASQPSGSLTVVSLHKNFDWSRAKCLILNRELTVWLQSR